MKTLLTLALLLIAIVANAAQSVTLAWNANTETNLAGYRLYYGTGTRSYGTNQTVLAPLTTVTITNLQSGRTYYFAVTAYTSDGLESDYSDEVFYRVPGIAPGSPAKPTILRISGATNNLAAIWIDQPTTNMVVEFSEDMTRWNGWAKLQAVNPAFPVDKAIYLTGVSPDSARFWRTVAVEPQVYLAPAALPFGMRMTPLPTVKLPPLPSVNP
jgi:hypothetical protein